MGTTNNNHNIKDVVLLTYRQNKGMNVSEIARSLDITKQYVSRILIESGINPSEERQERLQYRQRQDTKRIIEIMDIYKTGVSMYQELNISRKLVTNLVSNFGIRLNDLSIFRRYSLYLEIETLKQQDISQNIIAEQLEYHPNNITKHINWYNEFVNIYGLNTELDIVTLDRYPEILSKGNLNDEYYNSLSLLEKIHFVSEISRTTNRELKEYMEYPKGYYIVDTLQKLFKLEECKENEICVNIILMENFYDSNIE